MIIKRFSNWALERLVYRSVESGRGDFSSNSEKIKALASPELTPRQELEQLKDKAEVLANVVKLEGERFQEIANKLDLSDEGVSVDLEMLKSEVNNVSERIQELPANPSMEDLKAIRLAFNEAKEAHKEYWGEKVLRKQIDGLSEEQRLTLVEKGDDGKIKRMAYFSLMDSEERSDQVVNALFSFALEDGGMLSHFMKNSARELVDVINPENVKSLWKLYEANSSPEMLGYIKKIDKEKFKLWIDESLKGLNLALETHKQLEKKALEENADFEDYVAVSESAWRISQEASKVEELIVELDLGVNLNSNRFKLLSDFRYVALRAKSIGRGKKSGEKYDQEWQRLSSKIDVGSGRKLAVYTLRNFRDKGRGDLDTGVLKQAIRTLKGEGELQPNERKLVQDVEKRIDEQSV